MAPRGQSLEDKLCAAKYLISGQSLALVSLKATTSEVVGPKRKHLNYLVNMTNEPNVCVPNLVRRLVDRALHPDWSVSFKALITIHHLMCYGHDRFMQSLASAAANQRALEQLDSFVDRSTSLSYDMSIFNRRYARYLAVKVHVYRALGGDFCKMLNGTQQVSTNSIPVAGNSPPAAKATAQNGSGSNNRLEMRGMDHARLMLSLPNLHAQFEALLAFDATPRDLSNGVINSAFSMLHRDFVKLYILYQTAIIRLLELYLSPNCQEGISAASLRRARDLLVAYKRFLVLMDKTGDFVRVLDSVGASGSELPRMSRTPQVALSQLELQLRQMEASLAAGARRPGAPSAVGAKPAKGAPTGPQVPQLETPVRKASTRRHRSGYAELPATLDAFEEQPADTERDLLMEVAGAEWSRGAPAGGAAAEPHRAP